MPRMDGIEATRRIREAEEASRSVRTPIVAMTANASDTDRDLCTQAGMDDFQSKPISLKTITAVFQRYGTVVAGEPETAPQTDAEDATAAPISAPTRRLSSRMNLIPSSPRDGRR